MVTIKIKTSNDAFLKNVAFEVARILQTYVDSLKGQYSPPDKALFDLNGNSVGSVAVTGDSKK